MHIIVVYLHHLFIMVLMGSLIASHLLLKPGMDSGKIKSLAVSDRIYSISILLVLATGLLRFFLYGKGVDYYLQNPLFHTKLTFFILVALASIYPSVHFHRWCKQLVYDSNFTPDKKMVKRMTMVIRLELLVIVVLPLLAVLLNLGYPR